jgi:hypothetical protein
MHVILISEDDIEMQKCVDPFEQDFKNLRDEINNIKESLKKRRGLISRKG